jgi:hypothetical protein
MAFLSGLWKHGGTGSFWRAAAMQCSKWLILRRKTVEEKTADGTDAIHLRLPQGPHSGFSLD